MHFRGSQTVHSPLMAAPWYPRYHKQDERQEATAPTGNVSEFVPRIWTQLLLWLYKDRMADTVPDLHSALKRCVNQDSPTISRLPLSLQTLPPTLTCWSGSGACETQVQVSSYPCWLNTAWAKACFHFLSSRKVCQNVLMANRKSFSSSPPIPRYLLPNLQPLQPKKPPSSAWYPLAGSWVSITTGCRLYIDRTIYLLPYIESLLSFWAEIGAVEKAHGRLKLYIKCMSKDVF